MSEFPGIPWDKIILNLIWIFGLALILAVLSYFEFLVHLKKAKRKELFRKNILKKAILSGFILVLLGICASFILALVSEEPEAIIIKNRVQIPLSSLQGKKIDFKDYIFLSENGHIRTRKIQYEESRYLIRIIAYGPEVLGETPNIKMYIGIYQIADYFTAAHYEERIF